MARVSELAYIYAKTSGILARSYIGSNIRQLFGQQRLNELYGRIFGEPPPQLPERELVVALQRRVEEKTIGLYMKIIDICRGREAILIQLLRSFDYLNVKEILYAAGAKMERLPPLWDLGPYGVIRAEAYPDLPAMFGGTRFEWISGRLDLHDVSAVENELDRQYYDELWEIARKLPPRDRGAVELIKAEAVFQNIVWAARLRVYYDMDAEAIRARMIDLKGIDVVSEALASCSFPLDSREKWASWKYGYLINEEAGDSGFRVDPRVVEARAAKRLYAMTRRLFHSSPFSLTPAVCFFKLKEFEADILKSVAEGIQMNLPEQEILAFLGEPG